MRSRLLSVVWVVLTAIGFGFLFVSCKPKAEAQPTDAPPMSEVKSADASVAPVWQLPDLTGKTVQLSDFKGKVVILDFWATWCPPCRAEIPHFVELQQQYQSQGLVVVGVSLDQGGPGVVASFVKEQNINYPVVMGNEDVAKAYGNIEAIPTTFVIDPTGHIVGQHEGFTEKSVFEDEIKKVLPGGH